MSDTPEQPEQKPKPSKPLLKAGAGGKILRSNNLSMAARGLMLLILDIGKGSHVTMSDLIPHATNPHYRPSEVEAHIEELRRFGLIDQYNGSVLIPSVEKINE